MRSVFFLLISIGNAYGGQGEAVGNWWENGLNHHRPNHWPHNHHHAEFSTVYGDTSTAAGKHHKEGSSTGAPSYSSNVALSRTGAQPSGSAGPRPTGSSASAQSSGSPSPYSAGSNSAGTQPSSSAGPRPAGSSAGAQSSGSPSPYSAGSNSAGTQSSSSAGPRPAGSSAGAQSSGPGPNGSSNAPYSTPCTKTRSPHSSRGASPNASYVSAAASHASKI